MAQAADAALFDLLADGVEAARFRCSGEGGRRGSKGMGHESSLGKGAGCAREKVKRDVGITGWGAGGEW